MSPYLNNQKTYKNIQHTINLQNYLIYSASTFYVRSIEIILYWSLSDDWRSIHTLDITILFSTKEGKGEKG